MSDVLMTVLQDMRDLPALINAGADTFLIALKGAGTGALPKMSISEATMAATMAAGFGRKISVLADRMFHEGDLAEEDAIAATIAKMDVMYVLFQDPGFYLLAKKYGFAGKLIYKPDTLMTSVPEVLFWKERGVRAAVSPLVTLAETQAMVETDDVMVTIHGHTLMSRSARPLLSAWHDTFGVECAVKDVKNITLREEKREGHMPAYEDEDGVYIYTDDVLLSMKELPELMGHDTVFFADGVFLDRMEYMEAVRGYRAVLNGKDGGDVEQAYCEKYADRPFGKGYYDAKTVK